jgi:hypothetical protein
MQHSLRKLSAAEDFHGANSTYFCIGHQGAITMRTLREVNRRLLKAIEAPPDTGEEERLDRLAASFWARTRHEEYPLDPGSLCRLRYKLRRIAERTHEERAHHLWRARELLDEYATEHPPRRRT